MAERERERRLQKHTTQPTRPRRCPSPRNHHQTIARGQPPKYVGRDGSDDAGTITDNKSGYSSESGGSGSDSGSYTSASAEQEKEKAGRPRAWNSGSLLVRPGSGRPSERVPRTTYIYLVGGAGGKDGIEVEVIVGSGGRNRTVLSRSSGTTCACVPAQETYTVRNLYFGDGKKRKTAVLFWTSPSGDGGDQVWFRVLWLEARFRGARQRGVLLQ